MQETEPINTEGTATLQFTKARYIPRAANCCFLPEPGGRPLLRLSEGVDGDPATSGDDPESGVASGIILPSASVPVYLRGLPLFRFTGSLPPKGPPLILPLIPVPGGIVMPGTAPEGPLSIEGLVVPRVIPEIEVTGRVAAGACRPCGELVAPMLPPGGVPIPALRGCIMP